jgi:Asp-tRNA(Asn)/Glu-tRNA(Gln) amidotransferase A subunit family amidase
VPDSSSLSVRALAQEIAAGRHSAESATEACLDRVAACEGEIGAWEYLDRDAALANARNARPGPLHGVPIGVKDLLDTVDMPSAYGSPIYAGNRPASDAAAVAIARAAGAVVIGKTVTTEFATFTPAKTANPRNLAHTPGGSSSGSAAAVAAGMVPLAFASQTAGSIIRPAAFCGCIGYKPSFGLVPRAGAKGLAENLDTIGTMAATVADAAFFIGVIAGRPGLRDAAMPASVPRIGLCRTAMWDKADAVVAAALDRARTALHRAGAAVEDVPVPDAHRGLTDAQDRVMWCESARGLAYEHLYRRDKLSPRLAGQLDGGAKVTPEDYDAALAEAAVARAGLGDFFGGCDAMLVPAAPGLAPKGLGFTGDPIFNRMWTLLGTPCVTMPGLWGEGGLPCGVQLVGRIGDDARLMSCAMFLERALAALP